MDARNILIYLAIKHRGNWNAIFEDIRSVANVDYDECEQLVSNLGDCKALTLLDEDYPEFLKITGYKPPFVLFYKGNVSLLNDPRNKLAVLGTRSPKIYSKEDISKVIPDNVVIVSTLALGVATNVHEIALERNLPQIAVLGSGLNKIYPSSNIGLAKKILQNNGLLISEYPIDTDPEMENFPMRSRIVIGLCKGVLIPESKKHSGTDIAIAYALEGNKDVLVMPITATNDELVNNDLIKDGADIVTSAEDVQYTLDRFTIKPQQSQQE